jgi:hypothetical protein
MGKPENWKFENRKFETNSNDQKRRKFQTTHVLGFGFGCFGLFRISSFGFRVLIALHLGAMKEFAVCDSSGAGLRSEAAIAASAVDYYPDRGRHLFESAARFSLISAPRVVSCALFPKTLPNLENAALQVDS